MSDWTAHTPAEMMAIGADFAAKAKPGDVFGLIGTLGTGKTHWSKGFVAAIDPEATVTSPTFSILNEYRGGKIPLFHFDFYRLESSEELLALGWDEYLDESGIMICEWADMFTELMPENTIWLEITHLPDGSRGMRRLNDPGKAETL